RLHYHDHMEHIGKLRMPQGHLGDLCRDSLVNRRGFHIRFRPRLVIELFARLLTLSTACLWAILGERARGILAPFGNQRSPELSDHVPRIMMAKSPIKDKIHALAVRT